MKIAYVMIASKESYIGPSQSLAYRASCLAELNVDIDFIILNQLRDFDQGNIHWVRMKNRNPLSIFYKMNFRKYSLIAENIDLRKYEYVVIRYSFADKSGISFAKKNKLIMEHHTKSMAEMTSMINEASSLIRKISRRLKLMLENKYGPKMLALSKGIVAATDEIRSDELAKVSQEIPSITISNGISVEEIRKTGFVPFDGLHLNLVFLTSSSFPWNGLDRLAVSLSKYKGDVEIKLHILGDFSKKEIESLKGIYNNIIFHGRKSNKELDDIMEQMSLAIGPLTHFRNNMKEACPLKAREYTARGIPFIAAYQDADLSWMEKGKRFFLQIPNNDSLIDVQEIIDFAAEVSRNPLAISGYMREYALQYLDTSAKAERFIGFIASLAATGYYESAE